MEILIVEDEPVSRLILQKAVEKLGYRSRVAKDGDEGWELYRHGGADVIISDWMMPVMDGIELCRRVRNGASTTSAYTYFIIVTALSEREHFVEAMREGADDYLTKPLDTVQLGARLHAARRVTSVYGELASQKRELERLNDQQLYLTNLMMQSLGEGVCAIDGSGCITFANPAANHILGVHDELRGRHVEELGDPALVQLLRSRQSIHAADATLHRPNAPPIPVELVVSPIEGEGSTDGVVVAFRDITERKQAERERLELLERERAARKEAEAALGLRDEFLSIAAHELKTPLTSLLLQVQILQRIVNQNGLSSLSPQRATTMVETVERQIKRLLKLSNDLLDVSRLATQGLTLEVQKVELAALVRTVVDRFHYELTRSGSSVNLDLSPLNGTWDADRLEQVVSNLLANAIKHGQRHPIDIKVEGDEEIARIQVRDRGVGIAPQDQERIFDRFERVLSRDNCGGLGLGLYLARQLVEAQGGAIMVSSAPNEGSTFTVSLPRG